MRSQGDLDFRREVVVPGVLTTKQTYSLSAGVIKLLFIRDE